MADLRHPLRRRMVGARSTRRCRPPDRAAPERLAARGPSSSPTSSSSTRSWRSAAVPGRSTTSSRSTASPPGRAGLHCFGQVVDKGRPTLEMSPGVFEQRARPRPAGRRARRSSTRPGTTGEPKGAMLTHGNFVSNVVGALRGRADHGRGDRALVPPALARLRADARLRYLYTARRSRMPNRSRSSRTNFLEVNPSLFGAVPRVYEKVHGADHGQGRRAAGGIKKKLFLGGRESAGRSVLLHGAGGARSGRAWRARRRSPTSSCARRSARASGAASYSRSRAARRSRATLAEFFFGAGVHDLRGVRPDGDLPGHLRQRPGTLAPGHGRPADPRRRGQDRRGRRDPDARAARHEGVLQQARGDGRGDRPGWLVPHGGHRAASTRTASSASRTERRT